MNEPGPTPRILLADKGYDADLIRDDLTAGASPQSFPPGGTDGFSPSSTATSTPSETSSSAAS